MIWSFHDTENITFFFSGDQPCQCGISARSFRSCPCLHHQGFRHINRRWQRYFPKKLHTNSTLTWLNARQKCAEYDSVLTASMQRKWRMNIGRERSSDASEFYSEGDCLNLDLDKKKRLTHLPSDLFIYDLFTTLSVAQNTQCRITRDTWIMYWNRPGGERS